MMHRHNRYLPPKPSEDDVAICTCGRVFFGKWWDDNVGWGGIFWYQLHWYHRMTRPLAYARAIEMLDQHRGETHSQQVPA